MTNTIVVTGCDANHYALASELLASLRAIENRAFDIGFIQVGDITPPSSISAAVDVLFYVPASDLIGPNEGFQLAYLAIKARLPEFFPGYDIYVWLDGDTWVQNAVGIAQIVESAPLADICIHSQGDPNYFGCLAPDNYTLKVYQVIFGEEDRVRFGRYPMANSGVFGATAGSKVWHAWKSILLDVRERLRQREERFFSDQVPLHKLIYSGAIKLYPLRAVNNWLVLHSLPRLDTETGQLTAPSLPYEKINIVHLVGNSKRQEYDLNGRMTSFRYPRIRENVKAIR